MGRICNCLGAAVCLLLLLSTCSIEAQASGESVKTQLSCQQLGLWLAGAEQAPVFVWDDDLVTPDFCTVGHGPRTATGGIQVTTIYHAHRDVLFNLIHQAMTDAALLSLQSPRHSEQLAVHLGSLLCFPRLGLLWQRLCSSGGGASATGVPLDEGVGTWSGSWPPHVVPHQRVFFHLLSQAATAADGESWTPPSVRVRARAISEAYCSRRGTGSSTSGGTSSTYSSWLQDAPAVALFWLCWLVSPGLLVAHDAVLACQSCAWLAVYMCAIGFCQTYFEWRAAYTCCYSRSMTMRNRLISFAYSHVLPTILAALLSALVNAWVPLMGSVAVASAMVWTHALVSPAGATYAVLLFWMPIRRRRTHGSSSSRSHRGDHHGMGRIPVHGILLTGVQPASSAGGTGGTANAVMAVMGGSGGDRSNRAAIQAVRTAQVQAQVILQQQHLQQRQAGQSAAAIAAAVHWPPPLDVPVWLEEHSDMPDAFRCPITLCVMREPTQASSGLTYERAAIFKWLEQHRSDPVTHAPLKRHRLTPNLNLRHLIDNWARAQEAKHTGSGEPSMSASAMSASATSAAPRSHNPSSGAADASAGSHFDGAHLATSGARSHHPAGAGGTSGARSQLPTGAGRTATPGARLPYAPLLLHPSSGGQQAMSRSHHQLPATIAEPPVASVTMSHFLEERELVASASRSHYFQGSEAPSPTARSQQSGGETSTPTARSQVSGTDESSFTQPARSLHLAGELPPPSAPLSVAMLSALRHRNARDASSSNPWGRT